LILFRFLISPKSRQRDRKAIGDRRDVGVNGRREIPGMDIGPSVAETLRTAFFAQACPVAATRGGSPPALMGASRPPSAKVLNANRQRCRMRLMRQCPADAGKSGRRIVSAFVAPAFVWDNADQHDRRHVVPGPAPREAALGGSDRAPRWRDTQDENVSGQRQDHHPFEGRGCPPIVLKLRSLRRSLAGSTRK